MIALALLLALHAPAATTTPTETAPGPRRELATHPDWPAARPRDVATIPSIVEAFFSAISAPAGGRLDRQRLDSLFVPGGRIEIPLPPSGDHPTDVVFLTPDQYADSSDKGTASSGFFDHMLALHQEHFGVIAHAFVSYRSTEDAAGKKLIARGVKSFELLNSAGRFYIVQVSWDRERPGNAIPEFLLHDETH